MHLIMRHANEAEKNRANPVPLGSYWPLCLSLTVVDISALVVALPVLKAMQLRSARDYSSCYKFEQSSFGLLYVHISNGSRAAFDELPAIIAKTLVNLFQVLLVAGASRCEISIQK